MHFSTLIEKLSAIFGAMEKNDILTKSEVVSDKASNLLHKLLVRRNNVIACDNRMKNTYLLPIISSHIRNNAVLRILKRF